MPQTITVRWDDSTNAPTADDVTISTRYGAVVIQWEGDDTIASITGIHDLPTGPSDQFTAPQSSSAKVWTCTDKATADGEWSYSISGTKASSGASGTSDPMIANRSDR